MVSGESPHAGAEQTKSGQAGSVTTVPFEVVRRTEFVFEPFLGSLIQLPETGARGAQSSESFLPQSAQGERLQAVSKAEMLQAEAEASQAEVKPDAAPVLSTIGLRLQEASAARALAGRVAATGTVVSASLQTPPALRQWQIAEAEPRKKEKKLPLAMRILRWLWGDVSQADDSRRRAERKELPGLLAFYWSGGTPKAHEVVNISKTGFYMRTTELWSVETLVRMTLQRPQTEDRQKPDSVGVLARVVRIDEGGVGHEFVTTEALTAARSLDVMPSQGTNWKELDKFLDVG
jgi:hypothetical protein